MTSIHGIITRGVGGLYGVRTTEDPKTELLCRARGIFRLEHNTPTVGDDVTVVPTEERPDDATAEEKQTERRLKKSGAAVDYVIDEIRPRRSLLIRPPLANLDYLFAVIPSASPEPDLLTADKLTVIAENYGIEPVVVVNKADLDPDKAAELERIYTLAGYRVFRVSGQTGDGLDALGRFMAERAEETPQGSHLSAAFAGVSGAGKSTVMKTLFPNLALATGSVSRKTERGRHTTRHVELYPLPVGENGGLIWLADTPGFSVLDFTRFDFFPYDELAGSFREFSDCIGQCRYTKCTHLREEGCAVLEKMEKGLISPSRHDSYVRIYEEQRSVPEWKRR